MVGFALHAAKMVGAGTLEYARARVYET